MKEFTPISPITSIYKILAKVLANHSRKVLPSKILDGQGLFIVGRQTSIKLLLPTKPLSTMEQIKRELYPNLIVKRLMIMSIGTFWIRRWRDAKERFGYKWWMNI